MLHAGLTGGLASGKSFVGRTLADLGCFLIQADELGRQMQQPGGEAYVPIVQAFGSAILHPDGSIDRRKLARMVFADPDKLSRLNALVHPAVRARARVLADAYFREHPDGIAVTEAAILIETGSYRNYDRLIVAVCRPEQQVERAVARDGLTREEALERMRRQIPLDEKVKYADYVVDTSGSKEHTERQVRDVYQSMRSIKS